MIVTAFSDTHGLHRDVVLPKSDVLLFAGDCMTCGYKEYELLDFLNWYNVQDAKYKVMIAGNHDRFIESKRGLFLDILKEYPSVKYLENDGDVIDGVFIWGTPDSKEFCRWAFNRTEAQLEKTFSKIPTDVDILLSHAPQFGVLDQLERGEMVGEKALSKQFQKFTNIKYHVFGHIHYGYGIKKDTYTSMNVSLVNEAYELANAPQTFNIIPSG